MRRLSLIVCVLIIVAAQGAFAQTGTGAEGGIIPPPALHLPWGARIVMDANLSEGDVLGVAKTVLPGLIELGKAQFAKDSAARAKAPIDPTSIDFKPLFESISEVTNVRALSAQYDRAITNEQMIKDMEFGISRIGKFSKILAGSDGGSGVFAIYAQADGKGYVGFAFDPISKQLMAARLIGSIDLTKLMGWAADVSAKMNGGEKAD